MGINKNKGISLMVLAITIIVIIILAGVIVITTTKDNLSDKAKKARFFNDFTSVEEGVDIYSIGKIDVDNLDVSALPIQNKLSSDDKADLIPTLKYKIEELNPGKTLDDIDLYWINGDAIGVNSIQSNDKEKGYIIDIKTRQIYDYAGEYFENKMWHTLDNGVVETVKVVEQEEVWDGWMKLTLYYPNNSTDKKWRLGNTGEVRVDPMLMWQEYTGPITIPLSRIKDIWIKYKKSGQEFTVPPAGTLLVDIVPDKTGTEKVEQVNVKIDYDSEATTKEYKVGNSDWMMYNGPFVVTENCLIEARANKVQNVYDTSGKLVTTRNVEGSDLVYIGNIDIKPVEKSLAAPIIERLEPINVDEKARVKITYPENADKKIFKINYGLEENYTEEISIKEWGTFIIAYYYDINGKMSQASSIKINEGETPEPAKPYDPLPPYEPDKPIPVVPPAVTNPVITANPIGWTNKDVAVTITYPENYATKEYSLDGTTWQEYTESLVVTTNNTTIYAKRKR